MTPGGLARRVVPVPPPCRLQLHTRHGEEARSAKHGRCTLEKGAVVVHVAAGWEVSAGGFRDCKHIGFGLGVGSERGRFTGAKDTADLVCPRCHENLVNDVVMSGWGPGTGGRNR